ncbi:MAG: hypothetical protein ACR2L2_06910 [Acidobacteriota bacterium]
MSNWKRVVERRSPLLTPLFFYTSGLFGGLLAVASLAEGLTGFGSQTPLVRNLALGLGAVSAPLLLAGGVERRLVRSPWLGLILAGLVGFNSFVFGGWSGLSVGLSGWIILGAVPLGLALPLSCAAWFRRQGCIWDRRKLAAFFLLLASNGALAIFSIVATSSRRIAGISFEQLQSLERVGVVLLMVELVVVMLLLRVRGPDQPAIQIWRRKLLDSAVLFLFIAGFVFGLAAPLLTMTLVLRSPFVGLIPYASGMILLGNLSFYYAIVLSCRVPGPPLNT